MTNSRPISKDEITEIKQRYGHQEHVMQLIKEVKRLRRAYVGEELICMSPIAERTGRKVKILVNRLNEDAAHLAVKQGVEELIEEVEKWNSVSVEELNVPIRFKRYLQAAGIETIGELLVTTDKDLQKIDIFGENETFRISVAMKSLGIHP